MPESTLIPTSVFNLDKTDYGSASLILGQYPGIYDTIHVVHPELEHLYDKMRKQDWGAKEINHDSSKIQLREAPPAELNAIEATLAWQWETDTVAARAFFPIICQFVTDTFLHQVYTEITKNEVVHAGAYSHIVKTAYEDPNQVLQNILRRKEAHVRLSVIAKVLEEAYVASHKYALGMIPNDQELYDIVMRLIVAWNFMESIQFMASFPVSLLTGGKNKYISIKEILQKILLDEYGIHVKVGHYVINHEKTTERGFIFWHTHQDWMNNILEEFLDVESHWVYQDLKLNLDENQILGLDGTSLVEWTEFCAASNCAAIGFTPRRTLHRKNPLVSMNSWMNPNSSQGSPMEARKSNYAIGGITDDLGNMPIEIRLD